MKLNRYKSVFWPISSLALDGAFDETHSQGFINLDNNVLRLGGREAFDTAALTASDRLQRIRACR